MEAAVLPERRRKDERGVKVQPLGESRWTKLAFVRD